MEIYGPESSGKTTLTLQVVAEAQRAGGTAAFVDAEHALDPVYAGRLGVNVDELLISQPDTGEQALEITDMLVRSGAVDVIVVDSVAALTPKAEIEGEMGDSHVGLHARLMSQALRKLTANIKRSNCMVIFINQIRMKIGVMFGSPETTTGGNALKFYCSVRLDIRRIGAIKKADEVLGNQTRVKVVKNKLAPPFKMAEFEILYGTGISREGELIDLGVRENIVEKSGSWYSYRGDRLGQGKENVREFLQSNPDIASSIETELRTRLLPESIAGSSPERGRGGCRSQASLNPPTTHWRNSVAPAASRLWTCSPDGNTAGWSCAGNFWPVPMPKTGRMRYSIRCSRNGCWMKRGSRSSSSAAAPGGARDRRRYAPSFSSGASANRSSTPRWRRPNATGWRWRLPRGTSGSARPLRAATGNAPGRRDF